MKRADGNLLVRFGHLLVWHAKVVSGAYKQRRISHGITGPEFTDDEKLSDAIDAMSRHVAMMGEIVDEAFDEVTPCQPSQTPPR